MAKESTQSQNDGIFVSMVQKNFDRFHAMMDEMAKVENKAIERSHKNVEDASMMFKAGIDYTSDLNAQWRQMMVDGTKQTMELMTWGK